VFKRAIALFIILFPFPSGEGDKEDGVTRQALDCPTSSPVLKFYWRAIPSGLALEVFGGQNAVRPDSTIISD
jgi:hypothetical protein